MPLDILDPEVNRLAAQVAELNRTTETQAVKDALRHELTRAQRTLPLRRSIARLRQVAPPDTNAVVDKTFFDDVH